MKNYNNLVTEKIITLSLKMASLSKRPVDLFLVLSFLIFAVIALVIDFTQAYHGPLDRIKGEVAWPPPVFIEYYKWWCNEVDPLLGKNPLWYQTLAVLSPIIYIPFYLFAIYAFIKEREWIRIPTLMWAYGLILSMVPITLEQLYGEHCSKNIPLFWSAYGAYIVVPLLAMVRVANTPVFRQRLKVE